MALSSPLQRVYDEARANGLSDEAARAAVAIASLEGGYSGNVGDTGHSAGVYQFYFGWPGESATGEGNAFASAMGLTLQEAFNLLKRDPYAGNQWAFATYLGNALRQGEKLGLTGPRLASYGQKYGQRSQNPEKVLNIYESIWSGAGPAEPGPFTNIGGVIIPRIGTPDPNRIIPNITNRLPDPRNIQVPGAQDIVGATKAIADTLSQLPNAIVGPITEQLSQFISFGQWLGQKNLYLRSGLVLLGAILLLIGLWLLAISFVDPKQIEAATKVASVAA